MKCYLDTKAGFYDDVQKKFLDSYKLGFVFEKHDDGKWRIDRSKRPVIEVESIEVLAKFARKFESIEFDGDIITILNDYTY